MEPLVSVDCLTYNLKNYVEDALRGFLRQKTNFPFEVLIHDDASGDGTQDIIREYEKAYPDVFKVIYQKENQYGKFGGSLTAIMKNFQLPRYKGKYIAFCEGDDYWTSSDKLQTQVDYMEANADCSMSFHAAAIMENEKFSYVMPSITEETDLSPNKVITHGSYIQTASIVCRADIAKQWPRYRDISYIYDFPLKVHLATNGRTHYFPTVMCAYRFSRPDSWSKKVSGDKNYKLKDDIDGINWLAEFNEETKGRFAAEIVCDIQHYINDILHAGASEGFPGLSDFIQDINGKKAEIDKIAAFIKDKESELEKRRRSLYEDVINRAKVVVNSRC